MRTQIKDERGSVAVVLAALVAATLILGSIALVVDGGSLYLERKTVTNASQSAALALARECVEQPSRCEPSMLATQFASLMEMSADYAKLNSPDGFTQVTEICISGTKVGGGTCQTLSNNKLDCTPPSTTVGNYVRVRTESQSEDSSIGVRTFFSGESGRRLAACAQARWGNASSAAVYSPFAVSICEWAKQSALPRILKEFKSSDGVTTCTWQFQDLSGISYTRNGISGWAALDLQSTLLPTGAAAPVSCPNPSLDQPAKLQIGYQLGQITRDPSSLNYCGDSNLATKMGNWLDQTLYIPLVSTQKLSGNATIHTIEAFAAFKLLGYSLQKGSGNASDRGGTTPSGNWCPTNTNCIYGEFVSTVSSNSEVSDTPGVPNVGLQALELF